MKTKISLKVICLLLLLATLFSLSAPVFAVEITPANLTPADIVEEDESKREQYVKHYLTGDGSYYAVAYAEQVNYLDDDGVWQEVDNTLSSDLLGDASNKNNEKFKVKFKNKANKEDLVSIQTDDFKVSWGLSVSEDGESFATLNKVKKDIAESSAPKEITKTTDTHALGKAVSSISYKAAFGDYLDVRYTVSHEKVKEDIILNEASDFKAYRATYDISKIDGCTVTLQDDGSVIFKDKNGETLLTAAAPVMYDSDGATSADISVTLTATAKTAQITYTPSPAWLNSPDRVYPVTVDPSFSGTDTFGNIQDVSVYYMGGYSSTPMYTTLSLGMDYRCYIKFLNVPTIPTNAYIMGANVVLHVGYTIDNVTAQDDFNIYEVNEAWDYNSSCWTEFDSNTPNLLPERGDLLNTHDPVDVMTFDPLGREYASYDVYKLTLSLKPTLWESTAAYNSYFQNYHGFEIEHEYISSMLDAFSSRFEMTYSYRPYMVTRYYTTLSSDFIDTTKLYRIKNSDATQYIQFASSGNVSMSNDESNGLLQAVQLIQNLDTCTYSIKSVYYHNYLSYYSEAAVQDLYDTEIYSEPHYMWNFYSDGNTENPSYEICFHKGNGYTYMLTMYLNGSTYRVDLRLSQSIDRQKWYLEEYIDLPTYDLDDTIYVQFDYNQKFRIDANPIKQAYSVANPEILEINDFGIARTKNEGTTQLYAYNSDGTYTTHTVAVIPADGIYMLQNAALKNYMQKDDQSSDATNGAFMELHSYDGGADQFWELDYINDGYYKILTCVGKALTAQSSLNSNILQQDYDGSNTQKWKITPLFEGQFRFSPKSNSNRYLAAGDGVLINNGRNVRLRSSQSDGKDEWYICENDSVELMALCSSTTPGSNDYFEATQSNLEARTDGHKSTVTTNHYSVLEKDDMKTILSTKDVVFVVTHGTPDGIQVRIDTNDANENFLKKDEISDCDMSNLKLVVLLTCDSAKYSRPNGTEFDYAINFAEQLILQGAETVVGFNGQISNLDALPFAIQLSELLKEGYSVQVAINYIKTHPQFREPEQEDEPAENYTYSSDFLNSIVVLGNGDNCLRKGTTL